MSEIECPRCGAPHEPNGSHEDDSGEWECDACGFTFIVEIDYDPNYLVECKEHNWSEWKELEYSGRKYKTRECVFCGKMESEALPDEF